ncbi:hypothetical protein INS49_004809 [Diaporthe citri]|uniref:uncharacterized protein n=1 Tax=Diaporthe citri TaxID=83186 RepID=UPI001C7ECEB7|nr:uncharacterized protein INS49_004809 [Diaporthe citri]KAG6354205.1 hypothetical protein INS49_004809 [Diaporthe citri]
MRQTYEPTIGYQKVGTHKGTLTSDGGTYDVYVHQQVNQPSISGTTTFNQYISIRQTPRTSGTVTVANHFNAWKSFGMQLGTYNYQTISVESWTGSGPRFHYSQQVCRRWLDRLDRHHHLVQLAHPHLLRAPALAPVPSLSGVGLAGLARQLAPQALPARS